MFQSHTIVPFRPLPYLYAAFAYLVKRPIHTFRKMTTKSAALFLAVNFDNAELNNRDMNNTTNHNVNPARSSCSAAALSILALIFLNLIQYAECVPSNSDENIAASCDSCNILAKTFLIGLKNTERAHFGGGNTAWEEEKLGKYATSETRLVEVMEHTCRKANGVDLKKDDESRCQNYAEIYEEQIEIWYYHKQTLFPDFLKWLCVDNLKFCCPNNTWGADCTACPGFIDRPCYGRGICNGAGTRGGSGTCKCDAGYQGNMCRKCASNYFASFQNESHVTCEICDSSCKSGCKGSGSKLCNDCKKGWIFSNENGCEDVNECENNPCAQPHEECKNTMGSYECVCRNGFKRENGQCIVDFADMKEKLDEFDAEKDDDLEEDEDDEVLKEKSDELIEKDEL